MRSCPSCQQSFRSGAACPLCRGALVDAPDPRVGTSVGPLRLSECIARSATAAVYRGEADGRSVAVKIYESRAQPSATKADREERIRREREAQHSVQHACVARFLDSGALDDGAEYLVSEWIDGETLEERLARGPMSFSEALPILVAVGKGLATIHATGIVHRDLKPANLMIPSSGSPAAVILDFGHSLHLGEERLTETGVILGSASFMAPEQSAGATVDGRADLYALGVVLYRMLTGVLPFVADSPAEVMRLHQCEPVVPPSRRAPERAIPRAAEDLCLWLLTKDPAARLPNARVLAITLQTLGAPTTAPAQKENFA